MEDQLLKELILYIGPDYTPDQDSFLLLLVNDAIEEVCNEMFPYGFSSDEEKENGKNLAIKRYGSVIRKIAQYHYDKQGKEGLVGFSESGTSVSYESAGTPTSYLRGVIPVSLII